MDLDAIRERSKYLRAVTLANWDGVVDDIDALLAEVGRLTSRLAAAEARAEKAERECADLRVLLTGETWAKDRARARAEGAEKALRRVRMHTAHYPDAPRDLLVGLLASVERIADAALTPTPTPSAPAGPCPGEDARDDAEARRRLLGLRPAFAPRDLPPAPGPGVLEVERVYAAANATPAPASAEQCGTCRRLKSSPPGWNDGDCGGYCGDPCHTPPREGGERKKP